MANYKEWNQAIADFFFVPGRTVFLSCDRKTLITIANKNPNWGVGNPVDNFKAAVKTQLVNGGWSTGFCCRDKPPEYLALLAFLVFCAFENTKQKKSKGRGFYETLARNLDDSKENINSSKRSIVQLWDSYEQWLECRGKHKYVRLPEARSGPWYIVNIIYSQATMRDFELKKLPKLFKDKQIKPGQVVEPLIMEWCIKELSHHIKRCLKDERRDAVIRQACEFLKYWDGTIPSLTAEFAEKLPENTHLASSAVWCQILRRELLTLEGGLFDPQSESLSSIGTREEMFARLAKVEELLVVFNRTCGRYEEATSFSEGDYFLFFIPHSLKSDWQEDLELFSNKRHFYFPEDSQKNHLARLPDSLCALLVEVKETVDQQIQTTRWARFFKTQNLIIELSGGIPLKEGFWLTGFGPRVSCNAMQLNLGDELLPQGDALQQRIEEAWSKPGTYILKNWADTKIINIRDPEVSQEPVSLIGWKFCDKGWPELCQDQALEASVNQLIGNNHKQLKSQETNMPLERAWVDLNLQIRGLLNVAKQPTDTEHLLNRCMARAVQRRFSYGR